ncbi:MAG TPA: hypothetical protein PLN24_07035 [Victivallales bacterium]|nr:hypothetical protein [Victivallales bacterium]HRU00199.1 hypothetical protein [Victivallales bacterium]
MLREYAYKKRIRSGRNCGADNLKRVLPAPSKFLTTPISSCKT